jgi:FtsP/CotA-like multicopper oxidase with cupredoxin domain
MLSGCSRVVVTCFLLFLLPGAGTSNAVESEAGAIVSAAVQPNDNSRAAGTMDGATLTLALRAGIGRWQPEGPAGPSLEVEALGDVAGPLTVPAPLIRVVEGTEIALSIRNDLDSELTMHGLCTRGGTRCAPLQVPPHESREIRFKSGSAGTYHYWGSTLGAPIPFRELAGAFVVDSPTEPKEADRVLVITEWSDLTAAQLGQIMAADSPTEVFVRLKPRVTFVINGLSWPATERFRYERGKPVLWRVINLSSQSHPMHLHGFYFEVNSLGDGTRDSALIEPRPRVVTQLLPPGGTMKMTWIPERAGNWLFHCHVMHHVSIDRRIGKAREQTPAPVDPHAAHGTPHAAHGNTHDASAGMAGMVIGVTVHDETHPHEPSRPGDVSPAANPTPRKLTLLMQRVSGASSDVLEAGFVLSEGAAAVAETPRAPGPPIVLRRGEPVEITLVNQLGEATSIHWHGIELESFYDGVHAFSGNGRRVTPMIDHGSSFVVRFTPPRAGTFIYHTHLHDYRQLSAGLYGPVIVLKPGETFDPTLDHVVVLGRSGLVSEGPSILTEPDSVVINGQRSPRLVWKAGARHRVRLINISPDDIFSVSLQTVDGPLMWTPIAKDGTPLPPQASGVPARQTIAVGETYDFELVAPAGRKTAWLEVRTPGGKWQAQGHVIIR